MIPGTGTTVRRTARAVGPFAEVTAVVALAVVGVTVGSARAGGPSTTVLSVRLSGPGGGGRPVVVRAVDDSGSPGAAQRSRVVATAVTDAAGATVLAARPEALAEFADDTGWVDFESQVLVAGEPRFTSFSRRWTGTAWVDRDGVPAAAHRRSHAARRRRVTTGSSNRSRAITGVSRASRSVCPAPPIGDR